MFFIPSRYCSLMTGLAAAMVLGACATPPAPQPQEKAPPACQAAATDDKLVGNWLSIRKQKGVAGELRTLYTLNADGTMAYTELLKRGKNPSQGLAETGCWQHTKQTLVLQTLTSNGMPVDLDDPIYTNRYAVTSITTDNVALRDADGARITARRMSPDYRLPF